MSTWTRFGLALSIVVLLTGACGTGWATTATYTFDSITNPAGGWSSCWGDLTLALNTSGTGYLEQPTGTGLVDKTVDYTWQDYSRNDPNSSPGSYYGNLGELFDVEGIFYKHQAGWHNFLVVQSMDSRVQDGSTNAYLAQYYPGMNFWRGDLAINPGTKPATPGGTTPPKWEGGDHTADLGVKTGGDYQGKAQYDATWGYGAGTGVGNRDPRTDGTNPNGFVPDQVIGGFKGYGWGSNFALNTVKAFTEGIQYKESGPLFDGALEGGYQTYAYEVRVSDDVLGWDQVWGVSVAPTCLNNGAYLETTQPAPEPTTLVLLGCAAGAGAWVRRRKTSKTT